MGKDENTVRLLRYNNHICYVSNIIEVFQSFCCLNFDTFFNTTSNSERHINKCSEWVKNVYFMNVYQFRETLCDKLDSFNIRYTNNQRLFRNLIAFDFELIFIQEETFNDTNTTNWIGKHVPIYVSISWNIIKEPILLCDSDPHHLVASSTGNLKNLASQSKARKKLVPWSRDNL